MTTTFKSKHAMSARAGKVHASDFPDRQRLHTSCGTLPWCFLALFSLHANLHAQAAANPLSTASVNASTNSSSGLLQMLFGLGIVLAVIFAAAWLLRRLGGAHTGTHPLLKSVGSLSIGTRERVVVVEIEGQWLVLGVAPGRINTLHTLPKGDLTVPHSPHSAHPMQPIFQQKLQDLLRNRRTPS